MSQRLTPGLLTSYFTPEVEFAFLLSAFPGFLECVDYFLPDASFYTEADQSGCEEVEGAGVVTRSYPDRPAGIRTGGFWFVVGSIHPSIRAKVFQGEGIRVVSLVTIVE